MKELEVILDERDIRVVQNILRCWDDNDSPLEGQLSYLDVVHFCSKVGVDMPMKITEFLSTHRKPE